MALKNFPNNADEYIYAQDAMKWLFPRTQGVYGTGNNLAVKPAESGMAVIVTDGIAWLKDPEGNGCVCWNDDFKETGTYHRLAVSAASATQKRIDRVVLSWEYAGYVEKPVLKIIEGVPSSSPVVPAITNDGSVRQISLARINIPAGATAITASMITDERLDESVCGIVTEAISVDTSVMQAQFASLLSIFETAIENAVSGAILPHNFTHAADGSDPIAPEDIGAVAAPREQGASGNVDVTIEDNMEYHFVNVASLKLTGNTNRASGLVEFSSSASSVSISLTGFNGVIGDDTTEAAPGEVWEFDSKNGYIVFVKVGG